MVLTRPGLELSIVAFFRFLIYLGILWQDLGIFLNRMNQLGTSSTGSALLLIDSISYEEHLPLF